MMKREELSRIASVKFKKAITDCSHAVSHRVLAFCVMAACLVFTLAVTAANLRLTYVTDSHGARQVVLTSAESDPARVMNLSGIEAEEGDNVYYTAFSGNLASLNIERAFAVSIQADGQEYSVKMAVGTVADALERAGLPYRCRGAEDTFFTHRIVCDVCDILRFAAAPEPLRSVKTTGRSYSRTSWEAVRISRAEAVAPSSSSMAKSSSSPKASAKY